MKSAPKIDPNSAFGKFAREMRALVAVPKAELQAEIEKHEQKTRRSAKPQTKRRAVKG